MSLSLFLTRHNIPRNCPRNDYSRNVSILTWYIHSTLLPLKAISITHPQPPSPLFGSGCWLLLRRRRCSASRAPSKIQGNFFRLPRYGIRPLVSGPERLLVRYSLTWSGTPWVLSLKELTSSQKIGQGLKLCIMLSQINAQTLVLSSIKTFHD